MSEEKSCSFCGESFRKRPRESFTQWEGRVYCTKMCSNKSNGLKRFVPLEARFFMKFNKTNSNACWNWLGTKDQNGYGRIHLDQSGGKTIKAHRLSYSLHVDELIDGLVIMHLCDNPSCVNPKHLRQATQQENMRDCGRKGRVNKKSLLNLKPGAAGYVGAGPKSKKDIENEQCK